MTTNEHTTLVLGGTGRVGRRVTKRLIERGVKVRVGSRTGEPPFDWETPATWAGAFTGVQSAYLMYYPEVEWPGAGDAIATVAQLAVDAGVRRLVLLSARNQDEAMRCEDAVRNLPVEWTIVAPASFNQNFDEGVFLEPLRQGVLALPAGDNSDPFVDADDIADVAVAALTEVGHVGERYELTGPRLWTFAEGVQEIAKATGRDLRYEPITRKQFAEAIVDDGAPRDFAEPLATLISEFFDGRNSSLADGVERALHRKPRDFADWVAEIAPTGVWNAAYWLLAHPRFHLHFTPTSASWLNLVERWFAELTQKKLKRGVHRSVQALEHDIRTWLADWNEHPRPFIWTKTADEILDKVAAYCRRISDSDH